MDTLIGRLGSSHLSGKLSSAALTGKLSVRSALRGTINKDRKLSGVILSNGLSGKLSNTQSLRGRIRPGGSDGASVFSGPYKVLPKAYDTSVLHTDHKFMRGNVTVLEIPISEVSNTSGGQTVYIG